MIVYSDQVGEARTADRVGLLGCVSCLIRKALTFLLIFQLFPAHTTPLNAATSSDTLSTMLISYRSIGDGGNKQ